MIIIHPLPRKNRLCRRAFVQGAAAIALVATGIAAPESASAQQKPPILIGQVGINSGPAGSYGQMQIIMLEIAIEDINARGGINGSKVVLETRDAELDPAKAVVQLRYFERKGAAMVIGFISSSQWEAAAPLANQLQVPTITAHAAKPGLTVRPWTLRFGPTDETNIPGILDAARKKMKKLEQVVILSDMRQASGAAADALFKKALKDRGIKVLRSLEFTTGATDLSPLAIAIKDTPADLIIINALTPEALALANEFKKQGIDKQVLAHGFIWTGNFVSAAGDTAKGWYSFGWNTNDEVTGDNKLYASVAARFIEKAKRDPSLGSPPNIANNTNSYDALLYVAEVMRNAGIDGNTPTKEARQKIKDGFLTKRKFEGILTHSFTEQGDDVMDVRLITPDVATKTWKFVK